MQRSLAFAVLAALTLAPMAQGANTAATGEQPAMSASEHYQRAKAFRKEGKADLAMGQLDLAIALDPAMGAAYYDRADLHFRKGDVDSAIADYSKAIELLPTFPPAYRERGSALIVKREFKRAVADFDKAIELKADYADAFDERGYAYRMLQDYDRSIADYTRALEINPKLTWTYLRRCWVRAVANKELDLALADCEVALKANAQDAEAYETRSLVHFRKTDVAKARDDVDKALSLNGKLPKALYLRGLLKRRGGDAKGGDLDIAAAAKLDPQVAKKFAAFGVTS